MSCHKRGHLLSHLVTGQIHMRTYQDVHDNMHVDMMDDGGDSECDDHRMRLIMMSMMTYLIIVTDAADAVSVNFSGRCKFLQI